MKRYPAPLVPDTIIAAMQRLADSNATQGELIAAMREAGLSIIPSIRLLARFRGLTTNQAKIAVHSSETWADCRESNDALHDAALAAQMGPERADRAVAVREEVAP
jgi:hypothetical protein